jgi:hypothetical protein
MVLLTEYKNHSVEVIFVATTVCTKHKLEILNVRYHLGGLGRGEITTIKLILWKLCANFLIEFGTPVKLMRLIKIHLMKLAVKFILINSCLMHSY